MIMLMLIIIPEPDYVNVNISEPDYVNVSEQSNYQNVIPGQKSTSLTTPTLSPVTSPQLFAYKKQYI